MRHLFPTCALAAAAILLPPGAMGSQPARDLGQGLSYYRVHELPADLPTNPGTGPGPCVLDLRFAKADDAAAATLKAWVMFNSTPRTPVFAIENAGTAPALRAAIAPSGAQGLVVLAPVSARLAPDIEVAVSPETDQKAYDALEKGASLEALLTDYPDKPRIDEAYLEKEHIPDSQAPDVPTDKPQAAPPLVDLLLQRAVQLDRGLIALKRL